MLSRSSAWAKANPDRHRKNNRRNHYRAVHGITLDEFDAMLAAQGGKCGICGAAEPSSKRGWQLDHNHKTGVLRGILCHNCNAGGGMFGDDPVLLQKAAGWFSKT